MIDLSSQKDENHFVIAHLSDLHFSSGADEEDPSHTHSIPQLKGIEAIFTSKSFDRVIISGDISDAGDRESLIRAHSYIFSRMPIGPHESTGLTLSDSIVGIVPGNHDAFNAPFIVKGNSFDELAKKLVYYRQTSLVNYNKIFKQNRFDDADGCRYDYVEKSGRGIFIVYLDTCYLGDPDTYKVSRFERIARGRVAKSQAARIHEWFVHGMRGELASKLDSTKPIAKEAFGRSLKIIVAHHYLFEPRGYPFERLLHLLHRRGVFINIAASDFDLYLCGHKHVADFWPSTYGAHFDRKGKSKHLLNLYRRMINIHALPVQFEDDNKKPFSRNLTLLVQLIAIKTKLSSQTQNEDDENQESEQTLDDHFIEGLVNILTAALNNPIKLEKDLSDFFKAHKIARSDILDKSELDEIERVLRNNFTKDQRQKLEPLALRITTLARQMGARPFLQIMSGTSSKKTIEDHESPSFNIYTITFTNDEAQIRCEQFVWRNHLQAFTSVPRLYAHVIEDLHKAILA